MLKFWIWLKKKVQLEEIRAEHRFFVDFFAKELDGDEQAMRERLSELKTKKKQTDDDVNEALKIEKEINILVQIRGRIQKSEQIEKELEAFIGSIWR